MHSSVPSCVAEVARATAWVSGLRSESDRQAAIQAAGAQAKVGELTVQLLVTNKRGSLEIIGTIINGLGLLALAATLTSLGRMPHIGSRVVDEQAAKLVHDWIKEMK